MARGKAKARVLALEDALGVDLPLIREVGFKKARRIEEEIHAMSDEELKAEGRRLFLRVLACWRSGGLGPREEEWARAALQGTLSVLPKLRAELTPREVDDVYGRL